MRMLVYFHNGKSKLAAAGSAMLLGMFLGPVGAACSATLMPHRAFYEMQLGTADQNSNVQAVTGRSAFSLGRDCSGWQSNEDYVIEFAGKEGETNRIISRFASWESDAGDMYSFEISEQSSFQTKKSLLDMPMSPLRRAVPISQ